MSPEELAQHYTADELLAALCARMDPAHAVAAVRAVAPFLSPEDKAARERRLGRERSARNYAKKASDSNAKDRQKPNDQHAVNPSDSNDEASEMGGNSNAVLTVNPPEVPPVPPPNPASTPTAACAHVRPTVEMVTSFLNSTINSVPPDKRAEVAQAYLDIRNRTEPPWTLAATHDRPARAIGANWQADCRVFVRNWQEVLCRNAARETSRQQQLGFRHGSGQGLNAARPRAEPGLRASLDATDFARWLKGKYPRATATLQTATIETVQEYRQQLAPVPVP